MKAFENIEENLKKICKKRGMTIKNLCHEIGMTENGLSYSLKKGTLKIDVLGKICEILKIDVSYFFNNTTLNKKFDIAFNGLESYEKLVKQLEDQIKEDNSLIKSLEKLIVLLKKKIKFLEKEIKQNNKK